MKFTKLFEDDNQRFYEFDGLLTRGKYGKFKATQYIVISDSRYHNERLVFPAYHNFKTEQLDIVYTHCEGVQTSLTKMTEAYLNNEYDEELYQTDENGAYVRRGGDIDTIEPDENYLNRLIELNS